MTKKGRRLVGLFGLAFGSLFLVAGLAVMASAARRGLKQRATVQWPTVAGSLLSTDFNRDSKGEGESPLTYKFIVDGKIYRSTRVAFTDRTNMDYNDWVQLANGMPDEGEVTVHYNPDEPGESVLIAGDVEASWEGLEFGALFAGFAAFWMAAWWG